MGRKSDRARVERSKASSYADAAEEFFRSADQAAAARNWNAAGVLLVPAAIAGSEAISILRVGVKSTSENHRDAVRLLGEAVEGRGGREETIGHLRRMIDEKSRVSHMGRSWQARDYEAMRKHAERFRTWALRILGR